MFMSLFCLYIFYLKCRLNIFLPVYVYLVSDPLLCKTVQLILLEVTQSLTVQLLLPSAIKSSCKKYISLSWFWSLAIEELIKASDYAMHVWTGLNFYHVFFSPTVSISVSLYCLAKSKFEYTDTIHKNLNVICTWMAVPDCRLRRGFHRCRTGWPLPSSPQSASYEPLYSSILRKRSPKMYILIYGVPNVHIKDLE